MPQIACAAATGSAALRAQFRVGRLSARLESRLGLRRCFESCPICAPSVLTRSDECSRRAWRQVDLAESCSWSLDPISAAERGVGTVAAKDLPALCQAFEVALIKLLDGAFPSDLKSFDLG